MAGWMNNAPPSKCSWVYAAQAQRPSLLTTLRKLWKGNGCKHTKNMLDTLKKAFANPDNQRTTSNGKKGDIPRNKSAALYEKAKRYFPGGVNSPVRAFKSVYGTPLFIERGDSCFLWDADGN